MVLPDFFSVPTRFFVRDYFSETVMFSFCADCRSYACSINSFGWCPGYPSIGKGGHLGEHSHRRLNHIHG
ncbi:hypothetical protein H206_06162 [Candidatus Electrothrix aarhusensis]|uniref:Uncharacterized protein n=1 Tax=Candidatus Electrothrix aarhusensis TaxID=1859131 RepID=A0A3S3R142_9BACT|nr:hypothetical protein H206_06162 [Candidatus Electrothrix aarhusensis]